MKSYQFDQGLDEECHRIASIADHLDSSLVTRLS